MARFLHDPALYQHAWRTLEMKYGNDALVVETSLAAIDALQPWRDHDYNGLSHFSAELNGILANLTLVKEQHEVESAGNLRRLVAILPPKLTDDWGKYVYSLRPQKPTMIVLADWLDSLLAARNLIGLSTNAPRSAKVQAADRQKRQNVYNTTSSDPTGSAVNKQVTTCPCCNGQYKLATCKQFQGLPVERRA